MSEMLKLLPVRDVRALAEHHDLHGKTKDELLEKLKSVYGDFVIHHHAKKAKTSE